MKLLLIRHAESYSNTQGRIMSTTDLPLTEKGTKQAERAGQYMKAGLSGSRMLHAFCSDLQRTRLTAESFLAGAARSGVSVLAVPELSEMDLGELEGLTWEDRYARYPEINTETGLSFAVMPGGESYADVKARCGRFVEKYLSGFSGEDTVLIFSHGITLRAFVNTLLKRPDGDVNRLNWMENTAITEIEYNAENRTGQLVRLNDHTHLGELGAPDYNVWGIFCKEPY